MRGSLKLLQNNLAVLAIALFVILAAFAGGCSGADETERADTPETDLNTFISKSEQSFNPSVYNPEIETVVKEENSLYTALQLATVYTVAQPETIPGFRIQVILTQEIDEAMAIRDSLSNAYPEELIYMVYDAPTYKLRIGNYPDRSSASPLLKQLIRRGYTDAWIVPDNVLKNPPAKLPDHPIEPKNPLQNRR